MVKKFSEILLILVFVAFLARAMVGTIMDSGKERSFYENRNLASMPAFKINSVMNGKYFQKMENFLVDHAADRKEMLFAKTETDLDLFKRPVVNDVVVKDDILLSYCRYGIKSTKDLKWQVKAITKNLSAVSDTVKEYGGNFSYIAVPPQYFCHSDEYPWYMENWDKYTKEQISQLSDSLRKKDINFLDVGAVLKEKGVLRSGSSHVDNHYSIYGAFDTYKIIMEHLNQISGRSMHILSDDEVTITEVPNSYLGSYERKLLGLRNIDESLYRLDLNEPVDFSLVIDCMECNPQVYYEPEKKSKRVTYDYYMGGDLAESVIDTGRSDRPSILIYGDSFTNALECILYNSFDKMYSLDLRHYKGAKLREYIKACRPDYVICVRDYEALVNTEYNGKK